MTRISHIYFLLVLIPSLTVVHTHAMHSKEKSRNNKLSTSNNDKKSQRETGNFIPRTESGSPAKNRGWIQAFITDEIRHHYEETESKKQAAVREALTLYYQELREHSSSVSSKIS